MIDAVDFYKKVNEEIKILNDEKNDTHYMMEKLALRKGVKALFRIRSEFTKFIERLGEDGNER